MKITSFAKQLHQIATMLETYDDSPGELHAIMEAFESAGFDLLSTIRALQGAGIAVPPSCDECGERNTTVRFVNNEHRTCFACTCCSPKEAA